MPARCDNHMTDVKICGVTSDETLEAAIQAGAKYIGLVFFDKSPRNISFDDARVLAGIARGRAQIVALLVDPDDGFIDELKRRVGPDIFQLHGRETPERTAALRQRGDAEIWKAISVASAEDVALARAYNRGADLVLFDAKPPKDRGALPGGNGLAFDWRIVAQAAWDRPFALAGGLTPENVADAIKLIDPQIVDVSSGVECSPGVKDPQAIESFIRAAKTAKQSP